MRSRSGLIALSLAVLFSSPSSRAGDAEPVGVRIECDGGVRFGAGAVVRDFRREQGILVLTALHVIHACRSVEPKRATCSGEPTSILSSPWSASRPVNLLFWKDLDLAAIVVPDEDVAALSQALVHVRGLAAQTPRARGTALAVLASAGINVCPRIPAELRDVVTAQQIYHSLRDPDYYANFGSLDASAQLMTYQATVVPGTSGGPVLWPPDARGVVAVHLGGQPFVLGWGIVVKAEALARDFTVGSLDSSHPAVSVEGFEPPRFITEPNLRSMAALDVSLHPDSLLAMVETSTPIDPFGAVAIAPQIGWSREWFSPPFALLQTAFGTRVSIGGIFGQYRSPVVGANFEEPARGGTARLPFYGGFGEVDAELHLARLAFIQYVVSAGLRAGVSHQGFMDTGADSLVWGPVISARAKWPWSDRLSGLLQLHVSVEEIPVAATPVNCAGPSVPRPSLWDAWGGVSVGMELRP